MKQSQLKEQFSQAKQSLHYAATTCERNREVPAAMQRRLADWSRECERLRAALGPARDAEGLRARVEALERRLDLLARVCHRKAMHPQVELAVEHAHAVLAELRNNIH